MSEAISKYIPEVEAWISRIGISPETCRADEPGHWVLTKGSAEIRVFLHTIPGSDLVYLVAGSLLLKVQLPDNLRLKLYEEALRMNRDHVGVSFFLFENFLMLKAEREIQNMDFDEFERILMRVANLADEVDDRLRADYGVGEA